MIFFRIICWKANIYLLHERIEHLPICIVSEACFVKDQKEAISVPVTEVMAKPCRLDRLEECRKLLAENKKPPPIQLHRYLIEESTYYIVSNGNHRTVAARVAGIEFVEARVIDNSLLLNVVTIKLGMNF